MKDSPFPPLLPVDPIEKAEKTPSNLSLSQDQKAAGTSLYDKILTWRQKGKPMLQEKL